MSHWTAALQATSPSLGLKPASLKRPPDPPGPRAKRRASDRSCVLGTVLGDLCQGCGMSKQCLLKSPTAFKCSKQPVVTRVYYCDSVYRGLQATTWLCSRIYRQQHVMSFSCLFLTGEMSACSFRTCCAFAATHIQRVCTSAFVRMPAALLPTSDQPCFEFELVASSMYFSNSRQRRVSYFEQLKSSSSQKALRPSLSSIIVNLRDAV